jgi:hypothetical protein
LSCCGWSGPKDFAYSNEPIDASCYEEPAAPPTNSGIPARGLPLRESHRGNSGGNRLLGGAAANSGDGGDIPVKKMKSAGCGPRLRQWIVREKLTWATALASIFALEIMAVGIAAYILSRVKKLRKLRYIKWTDVSFLLHFLSLLTSF